MTLLRIDTHGHLYDSYPLRVWCEAAIRNFPVSAEVIGVVFLVDREGQDSFKRFREELDSSEWIEDADLERSEGRDSLAGMLTIKGRTLYILRGVQYVSSEKL